MKHLRIIWLLVVVLVAFLIGLCSCGDGTYSHTFEHNNCEITILYSDYPLETTQLKELRERQIAMMKKTVNFLNSCFEKEETEEIAMVSIDTMVEKFNFVSISVDYDKDKNQFFIKEILWKEESLKEDKFYTNN